MYQLSGEALRLADHLIVIMSFVMVGMSYQMPVSAGIIQGGGDTKFNMVVSMISTWRLSCHYPCGSILVEAAGRTGRHRDSVGSVFKGIPAFIRFRSYRWVKN